jgi:hypothetical protein
MLRRACPRSIEGDNFIDELSLIAGSLDSEDFSLGETNLSSCCNIFVAISLDFEGKGGKLVLALVPFTFSSDLCLTSSGRTGFRKEDEGCLAVSTPDPFL